MPRPRLGDTRTGRVGARADAGGIALLAVPGEQPRLALREATRILVLTMAPNGSPHAYETPIPAGRVRDGIPLDGEPLDRDGIHALVEGLAGGSLGIPGIDELARRAGAESEQAAALAAAVPDLLERAGFPMRFIGAMKALRLLSHTSAEQRRLLFSDDPGTDALRELCASQPYLAEAHWGEAARAIETGRDPAAAVTASAGLPAAVLRRLAGVPADHFITGRLTPSPSYLADLLRAVPPEWIPAGRDQRRSFSALADALPRVTHRTGVPLARLVSACKGDWTALVDRCRTLTSDGREEPRPLHACLSDIEDFPRHFADKVVGPLAARSGIGEIDRIGPHARRLAARAVYRDRTVISILEMSRRWHGQQNRIDAAVPDRVGPDEAWVPLCLPRDHGDLRIVALNSGRQIIDEGAEGPDATGALGLSHCVGSYRGQARRGECHILSVRRILHDGSYVRLATAEVVLGESGRPEVRQVRGLRNAAPAPEVEAAIDAFCAGSFPPRAQAGKDAVDAVSERAGYDWRDEDALAQSIAAFQGVLPKALRTLSPDALAEAFGLPSCPAPVP